jgi:hypothetical protein
VSIGAIPTKRLMVKLGLTEFRNEGPLVDLQIEPVASRCRSSSMPDRPRVPIVRAGDPVSEGDLLAAPAPGALGARIHASIRGTVTAVNGSIVIDG